jgi:hypothetical protein
MRLNPIKLTLLLVANANMFQITVVASVVVVIVVSAAPAVLSLQKNLSDTTSNVSYLHSYYLPTFKQYSAYKS